MATIVGFTYLAIFLNFDELRQISILSKIAIAMIFAGIFYVGGYAIYEINQPYEYDKYIFKWNSSPFLAIFGYTLYCFEGNAFILDIYH